MPTITAAVDWTPNKPTPGLTTPACEGWWDCLGSTNQTILIATSIIAVAIILAALLLRRRRR